MKKRFISVFLCFAVCLTAFSSVSFAVDTSAPTSIPFSYAKTSLGTFKAFERFYCPDGTPYFVQRICPSIVKFSRFLPYSDIKAVFNKPNTFLLSIDKFVLKVGLNSGMASFSYGNHSFSTLQIYNEYQKYDFCCSEPVWIDDTLQIIYNNTFSNIGLSSVVIGTFDELLALGLVKESERWKSLDDLEARREKYTRASAEFLEPSGSDYSLFSGNHFKVKFSNKTDVKMDAISLNLRLYETGGSPVNGELVGMSMATIPAVSAHSYSIYNLVMDRSVKIEKDKYYRVELYESLGYTVIAEANFKAGQTIDVVGGTVIQPDTPDGSITPPPSSSSTAPPPASSTVPPPASSTVPPPASSGGGGSGGGSSGTDWLGTLLKSLLDGFLKLLNSIVGGVVDVIVGLVSKLVDGITTIINSLFNILKQLLTFDTEFGKFLSVFFNWLPPEVIVLMTTGLSLSIILAVVRFLRK